MLKVVRGWIDRYFSDEEALLLLFIIGGLLLLIMALGSVLAPFFNGGGRGLSSSGRYELL